MTDSEMFILGVSLGVEGRSIEDVAVEYSVMRSNEVKHTFFDESVLYSCANRIGLSYGFGFNWYEIDGSEKYGNR